MSSNIHPQQDENLDEYIKDFYEFAKISENFQNEINIPNNSLNKNTSNTSKINTINTNTNIHQKNGDDNLDYYSQVLANNKKSKKLRKQGKDFRDDQIDENPQIQLHYDMNKSMQNVKDTTNEIVVVKTSKSMSKIWIIMIIFIGIIILTSIAIGVLCGLGYCSNNDHHQNVVTSPYDPIHTASSLLDTSLVMIQGHVYDATTQSYITNTSTVSCYSTNPFIPIRLSFTNGTYNIVCKPQDNGLVMLNITSFGYAIYHVAKNFNKSIATLQVNSFLTRISVAKFSPLEGINITMPNMHGTNTTIRIPPFETNYTHLYFHYGDVPAFASPGSLESTDVGPKSNSTKLHSAGMTYMAISTGDDTTTGTPLGLPKDFHLSSGVPLASPIDVVADEYDTYKYSISKGLWVPTSASTVTPNINSSSATSGSRKLVEYYGNLGDKPDDNYWNTDRCVLTGCLVGRVVSKSGVKCTGLQVNTGDMGIHSIYDADHADQDGKFCLENIACCNGFNAPIWVSFVFLSFHLIT